MQPSFRRRIRTFISSPRDVAEERGIVRKVLTRLNGERDLSTRCVLEAVDWKNSEADTPYLADLTPQEAIDRHLPRPDACHIVVVILWSRIGTPLNKAIYTKPDGSEYRSGTEYEYEQAMVRAVREKRPRVLVYRRTTELMLGANDPDVLDKLSQWNTVRQFFAGFQNSDGSWKGSYAEYANPAEFESSIEVVLRRQIEEILAAEPDADDLALMKESLWTGSPFPGLRAFTPNDASIYFGRETETDELVSQLADPGNRFVAVVGASGSGKSSLVGAGLLPRLADNAIEGSKDWRIIRFTPSGTGQGPFEALADQASKTCPRVDRETWAGYLRNDPSQIEAMCGLVLEYAPLWAEVLLIADQLEEAFTLAGPLRQIFFDLIERAATLSRVRLVATLRADFLHRFLEYPNMSALLRRSTYTVGAPRALAQLAMITRPATYAGLRFESDLAERILSDTGTDPGSLALMAYLLDELYRVSQTSAGLLTYAAYRQLGEVQGAIATRAENVYQQLDEASKQAVPFVFGELAHVDERGVVTRQRIPVGTFAGNTAALNIIEGLTRQRLLVKSVSDTAGPIVEVAHEALLRGWPRLEKWIQATLDDRRLLAQMRVAAQQWERHERRPEYLWTHERAIEMLAMLERLHPRLNETERDFARPETAHLVEELARTELTHDRRAQIGDRLAELGDPRPGIGLTGDGVPDISWCAVEASETGLPDYEEGAAVLLEDQSSVRVRPFDIALYPVTYAQYSVFVSATDGFRNPEWWQGLVVESGYRTAGVQHRRIPNHPAENVSWYDAVAFCRWLSSRLGYPVRLPTEAEWQLAATANRYGYTYPWGPEWRPRNANTAAAKLSRSVGAGMYPAGAAPSKALDMAGNVYEWTMAYRSQPDKQVLRGGSWYHTPAEARTMARFEVFAFERLDYAGFRLARDAPVPTTG